MNDISGAPKEAPSQALDLMADPISDSVSFEEALQELSAIVEKFEKGALTLDQAVVQYRRGTALKNFCEKKIEAVQRAIEEVSKEGGGPQEDL